MPKCAVTPDILLPKNVDMHKWAIVACDQFTSQPDYWQKLEELVGNEPSMLRLIFPEVYLSTDNGARIGAIRQAMDGYIGRGIFRERKNIMVLVEREVENGAKRKGLVLAVDLEKYDWRRVKAAIRATEDTIMERLPVRVEIRKDAQIESPHILLLIDDKENSVIEPVYNNRANLSKLYDFDLNMGGGHIIGYEVKDTAPILSALEKLSDPELQKQKYGFDAGIVFAVGDGNHSLATAKMCWQAMSMGLSEEEKLTHPARYALVEVVNIYDDALIFEPIHRVVFNGGEEIKEGLKRALAPGAGILELLDKNGASYIPCSGNAALVIKQVQQYLESVKKADMEIDYVHGDEHLAQVVAKKGGLGIKMPIFEKGELFNYVLNIGNLPKKAFSIGSAETKKYYLECKKITKD
ncbi:MAG: DUF1015 domain-containing protein [Christensenellales bacterium]|jgi:hypothetical protein